MEEDNKCYIRLLVNGKFGFIEESDGEILETDIEITKEDYNLFFKKQSEGKQFRLKEKPTGQGLFDYVEEYTPEIKEVPKVQGVEDYLLDIEYRLSKIELGGIVYDL